MRQDKKLMISMTILFLIVFVTFGVIIVNDKFSFYYIPKIDKKINNYIDNNYSNIKEELKIGKTKYKNGKYYLKLTSKENKDLYFYIYYNNREITDTYKNNYKEGNVLLKKIEKELTKEIFKKTKKNVSIKTTNTLNHYSKQVRKKIINEDNLISLKVYNINYEIKIDSFNEQKLEKVIKGFNNNLTSNYITPKYINIIITNQSDITNSIEINNLESKFIENPSFKNAISDIINKKESNILKEYNITYKYLN